MRSPTQRQQEILEFIEDEIELYGRPPTVREIGVAHGITSPNGVVCHLTALEKKGEIEIDRKLSRGIRLLKTKGRSDRETELLEAARTVNAEGIEIDFDRIGRAVSAYDKD